MWVTVHNGKFLCRTATPPLDALRMIQRRCSEAPGFRPRLSALELLTLPPLAPTAPSVTTLGPGPEASGARGFQVSAEYRNPPFPPAELQVEISTPGEAGEVRVST